MRQSRSGSPLHGLHRARIQALAVALAAAVLAAACSNDGPASRDEAALTKEDLPPGTLFVNSTLDEVDAAPGDGVCASASGLCTVRAAIMEANASGFDRNGERFTIMVPAGAYRLSLPNPLSTAQLGLDEVPDRPVASLDSSGSLLLRVPMTLRGAGARHTIIDASRLDRVFEIGRAADSTLTDLTITGGAGNTLGGGVYAQAPVRLQRVHVTGNEASGGGGIFINPTGALELVDSTVSHNRSLNQAGGIRIDSRGTILNSTISHNRADGPVSPLPLGAGPAPLLGKGGGVDVRGRDVTIVHSTIAFNSADAGGAGIHFAFGYTDSGPDRLTDFVPGTLGELRLLNTIVAMNTAAAGPADCMTQVASSVLISLGGNLDLDGSCFLGSVADLPLRDPLLGPLTDAGGPTDTHALRPGSPAIGTALESGCLPADQRGVARPRGGCDIGAYQRE